MTKHKNYFNLDQQISSALALIFVALLSLVTAWYTVNAAQGIIEVAKESPAINFESRMKKADRAVTTDGVKKTDTVKIKK